MQVNKTFKDKLYDYTLPVDEKNWKAIESRLPRQKDNRPFPFFWLFLFTGVVAGALLMTRLSASSRQSNTPDLDTANTEAVEQSISSASSSLPFSTHEQVSHDLNSTLYESATVTTTSLNHSSSDTKISTETVIGHIRSSSSQEVSMKSTSVPKSVTGLSSNISIEKAAPNAGELELRMQQISASSASHTFAMLDMLPSLEPTGISSSNISPDMEVSPDDECYSYRYGNVATGVAFSIDLLAGPGFSPRSFITTGGESDIYANARNNTEFHQYAFSTGARVNLHLSNGFAARTGFIYHQTGDIFDYKDSLATQTTTRIDSFFAADGTFLYAESVTVVIPGTLVKRIHNTYRQIDIPLLVGYEMPWGKAMLMINAGPVFNLANFHRGQVLDPSLHPRHIAPGGHPANQVKMYKSNLGLSLYFGAGGIFPLSKKVYAVVEPRFLYRLKPVTLNGFQLQERRHFAGVNFGLQFHLL